MTIIAAIVAGICQLLTVWFLVKGVNAAHKRCDVLAKRVDILRYSDDCAHDRINTLVTVALKPGTETLQ